MNIKDFKSRLDNREIIDLHNGEDLAQIARSRLSNDYIFIFNARALFGFKTFRIFEKRANEKIEQYSLIELIG